MATPASRLPTFAPFARFVRVSAALATSLAATAAGARTVSIASESGGALALAFGDADGSAYTLAWGYGAADAGAATNAWDSFKTLGTVAADATSQTVPLPAGWGDTVKSLRFFLLAPETRPYAKRLEYIESSGSQWIDTGVRGKVDVTAEVDIICTSMGDQAILASRKDGGDTRFTVIHWNAYDLIGGLGGHGFWYWASRHVIEVGDRHVIRAVMANGTQSVSIDGATIGTPKTYSSSFDSGYSMYLLAVHKGSETLYPAHAKLYSAKIWLDGDLKRDFVPCKDGSGVVCMYDLVDGRYFYNGGSGTFAAGAEVPLGLVVSGTSAAHNWVSANTLVVQAGIPMSLSADFSYDAVLLRDILTLTGGTLTTPTVTVDGPGGGVEINGGTLPSSARLSLSPDVATENEYATVLALRRGKTTLQCATNANAAVAARIHFLGGSLGCTSFSGTPLCSANGGKWILEGTATHPIRFGPLEMQRMSWLAGDGSVETRGYCDVLLEGSGYNSDHDYRSTVYLNTPNTTWNHTGDFVVSNTVDVICRADDCLPSGPQTGGVVLKWINRAGPPAPRLDLNGRSVAVNGIDARAGGVVTNSSSTVATIRIGEGDTIGGITNVVFSRANINLVKRGEETNTVSLGASRLAALRVESGTLVVTGSAAEALTAASVEVADGATLVIERTAVCAVTFSGDGAVESLDGGALEVAFGGDGSADTLIWDDPALPSGSSFIKVGSNRVIVQTAGTLAHNIDVRGGSLVFSGRTCTNEWYKFVFNGSAYDSAYPFAMGDLGVFSDTNKTENVAKGIGADNNVLAAGTDPANLARGQCCASFATTTSKPSGQENKGDLHDLRNAFDGGTYNAVLSGSTYKLSTSPQWIAFRVAADKNRVQCYLPVASYYTWYWNPSAWIVQTSPDGTNWTTVDSRTGAISNSSQDYGSTPFAIKGFLADGAAGFDPEANVKVASGATLDASGVAGGQTLSRLTIDMTAGAGTIRGVAVAQGGVLNLVNVPAGLSLHDATIPVTLLDIADGRNFSTWTVLVDGRPARTGTPKWSGGTLSLFDGVTLWLLK